MNVQYNYQKPQYTYTLDQYIACKSDSVMCYHNLSFSDIRDGLVYDTYNVTSDYIDELREEYCVNVVLSESQLSKYKYRPKLLCYDIYGNGELAFIILLINDMANVKQFNRKNLLMPKRTVMKNIIKYLYNANKNAISTYRAFSESTL